MLIMPLDSDDDAPALLDATMTASGHNHRGSTVVLPLDVSDWSVDDVMARIFDTDPMGADWEIVASAENASAENASADTFPFGAVIGGFIGGAGWGILFIHILNTCF